MAFVFRDEDFARLFELVQNGIYRDSSGHGNNVDNPHFGAADNQFIRLTDPYYMDGANEARTTVNTAREISNIISNQDTRRSGAEEDMPNLYGGTAFLTFFGQYFDHGLDFVDKGIPGRTAIGTDDFPISAPRANWAEGTGIDPDGVPNSGDEIAAQHVNETSPLVDQNQAYGSHDAITQLLREWKTDPEGNPVATAYLLKGELDQSGNALLPTLNAIRDNYIVMTNGQELTAEDVTNYDGTGVPLLIDFIPVFLPPDPNNPGAPPQLDLDAIGHYYVAGDGRANENLMLTSIHTIWARNHNFWVDELKARTNDAWTEDQYFEAARTMNIAEYQRVVFTEFAEAMAGGIDAPEDGGPNLEHGFGGYDPTVDAAISAEFAHVAYRFGHSMLNEEVTYVDTQTGQQHQTSLVEAFLRPDNVDGIGIDNLLAGSMSTPHQAIDVYMTNALRNQLVGRPLDLAALNIYRGRDTGVAPFNEVRRQLHEQTGDNDLRPYTGWADFQEQNNLDDAFIARLQEAYPEGFEEVDLWIGGLAEAPANGQLGSTFGYIFLEQLDRLQHGDQFYYLDLFDDALFLEVNASATFKDILERNTGLTDLPANVFMDFVVTELDGTDDDHVGSDGNDLVLGMGGHDTIHGMLGDDDIRGYDGNDRLFGDDGDDVLKGEDGEDQLRGGDGNDAMHGGRGNDYIVGGSGRDSAWGGDGNDRFVDGGGEGDHYHGGAGVDMMVYRGQSVTVNLLDSSQNAGAAAGDVHAGIERFVGTNGDDEFVANDSGIAVFGRDGDDTFVGGAGDDYFAGGSGSDTASGGDGNDRFVDNGGDADDYDGGAGVDMMVYHGQSASVNLADNSQNAGSAAGDTHANIERFVGTNGDDTFVGDEGDNFFFGRNGDDTFEGGSGRDSFVGGLGADSFVFRPGLEVDVVRDYEQGVDVLDISAFGVTAETFADDVSIEGRGPHTHIVIGEDRIILVRTDAADIDQDDLLLAV